MAQQLVKTATVLMSGDGIRASAVSPDRTRLASLMYGSKPSFFLEDIGELAKLRLVECGHPVNGFAWSPDSKRLIAVTMMGSVLEITNNNAPLTVFEADEELNACAFSPRGILALGGNLGDRTVTLLDPSNKYSVIEKLTGLESLVTCLAFSPDENLLAVGCFDGRMYIFGQTNGKWAQVEEIMEYEIACITSLCFSPCGRMLLVTSEDKRAYIYNVPSSGATWPCLPDVTFKGHINHVTCGTFLDESHIITGALDKTLRVWSISKGKQTAKYKTKMVTSLSCHAASGIITVTTHNGEVEQWQTDPQFALYQGTLPDHVCVRDYLAAAQTHIKNVEASLGELQTTESREYNELTKRRDLLRGIINDCTKTLDSLTDSIKTTGLADVSGDAFKEWLCDINMRKLQTYLKDVDGRTLTMLNADDVIQYDVTFNDASSLLLRAYIAHNKLIDDKSFAPPRGSVLSWGHMQTGMWVGSRAAPFNSLFDAGWNGAALCSLLPPRVIEASKGKLNAADAVKFIEMVRKMRSETDGDKATWVSKWSGASTIDNQPI